MKAFVRSDGLKSFFLWITAFACYIGRMNSGFLGVVSSLLTLYIPFYAARLLRRYRDDVAGGLLSFRRGWAYVVLMFFYAALLFAAAQFVFFQFIDNGSFMEQMTQTADDPEIAAMLKQYGGADIISEAAEMLRAMRPVDMALNILMGNVIIGCILAVPIAYLARRRSVRETQ